jgi:hypothetical protein
LEEITGIGNYEIGDKIKEITWRVRGFWMM